MVVKDYDYAKLEQTELFNDMTVKMKHKAIVDRCQDTPFVLLQQQVPSNQARWAYAI